MRLRKAAAAVCLAAIALAIGVVPGLHAAVHYLEDHAPAPARRWRVEASKSAPRAPHDHHHHHHDGDERGGHGNGAPEHLGVAILEAAPPALPATFARVDEVDVAALIDRFRSHQAPRAHGIRGPPGRLLA